MMLEQKQEKLIAAVEAAGYRFAKEESNSQHLQFIPDGTHRMQGHLFAKSWNEVERWVEAIIEKGDPIQKERVERVIYPERFEQSLKNDVTRKNAGSRSIIWMKMDLEEINYLWEWKICRKRGSW